MYEVYLVGLKENADTKLQAEIFRHILFVRVILHTVTFDNLLING